MVTEAATAPSLTFARVRPDDEDLLRRWLSEPHVRRWWGPPEQELERILSAVDIRGYVVRDRAEPVGYVQGWRPRPDRGPDWQRTLDPMTMGIDLFVGDPERTGRGLGPAIIAAFVARLRLAGATRIVIDPDPGNRNAIRAYEKAGFAHVATRGTAYIMTLEDT